MIPASPAMADQLINYIVREFPEYVDLSATLALAAKTWPRFGIGAEQLLGADDYELNLIRIYMGM